MNHYPEPVLRLIASLSKLPGVGKKTAERLTLHILHAPDHEAATLAADILDLKNNTCLCQVCFALTDQPVCRTCTDPSRDQGIICVVENPADMAAVEKANVFKGTYHILGGTLSPIDGIGPDDIRIRELLQRAKKKSTHEIILATRTNVEGEATASYIFGRLEKLSVTVTRIASGIPMGGELQYVDQLTMQKAMEKRHGI